MQVHFDNVKFDSKKFVSSHDILRIDQSTKVGIFHDLKYLKEQEIKQMFFRLLEATVGETLKRTMRAPEKNGPSVNGIRIKYASSIRPFYATV